MVITPGEPAGIGPDICLQLVRRDIRAGLLFIADPDMLQQRASHLGIEVKIEIINDPDRFLIPEPGRLRVYPIQCTGDVTLGELNTENARYVIRTLDTAIELTHKGEHDAVVTAPVHKGVINDAGIAFTGHTEWLADKIGVSRSVMMLVNGDLRVALATTHLPLKDIPAAITGELLEEVITILHNDLQTRFHIQQPYIHVCGLNPHAGENGHLGMEEIEVITPALEKLRQRDMHLIGPVSADTAFLPDNPRNADAILAMYHDQGLPVLKYSGFNTAVNITLGLPIIRTSVDHGTALELAGTGKANVSGLNAAIDMAIQMATPSA